MKPRRSGHAVGRTTHDNPYVLLTISSRKNLDNLGRLVEINKRLADPAKYPHHVVGRHPDSGSQLQRG
ncbi:MAG: hypothetical protein ABW215_19250 [Kibdelosporangium sp.]